MATHAGMLLAYLADGSVVGTLDYLVQYDDDGVPLGLVDFAKHEENGGNATDYCTIDSAVGAKVWPEWLGGSALDFKVELEGPAGNKRIAALVHKTSGYRRERVAIETEIDKRIKDAKGAPADIRDLVGGPDKPLQLDDEGKTKEKVTTTRPNLPLIMNVT